MKVLLMIFILSYYIMCLFYYYKTLTIDNESYSNKIKWDDIISECYYINLERSVERRKYMEEKIKKIDIPCTRFVAKEGKEHRKLCNILNISDGALGCKLSHLEILKNIKNNNKWTIIFEDDVLFEDCKLVKKEIIKFLSDPPESSEFVLFGTSPRAFWYNFVTFGFKYYKKNIWKTNRNLSCCHAYAIKYSGAQKWITQIEKFLCKKPFDMHYKGIDCIYLCNSIKNKKDFFRMIGCKDFSYIRQNKNKFGYFDSLVTDLSFFS